MTAVRPRLSPRPAFILVISLFFLWGLATNLVNALNEPFQRTLGLSATQTSLLQVVHYIAYFLAAIPAALVARRWGYKSGLTTGLAVFGAGALATIPAVSSLSYPAFLTAMFIMAAGMAALETNASPYVAKFGNPRYESLRLNIAQSLNGVGSIAGPLAASAVLAGLGTSHDNANTNFMRAIGNVYVGLALVTLVILAVFLIIQLPETGEPILLDDDVHIPRAEGEPSGAGHVLSPRFRDLWRLPSFTGAVASAFVFIGVQITVMSQLASLSVEQSSSLTSADGARVLAMGSALFAIGRIATTPLMARLEPGRILGFYMLAASILLVASSILGGISAVVAAVTALFFLGIGYPTIYALGLRGLGGDAAKNGASLLTMALVGGAIIPFIFGAVADATATSISLGFCGVLLLVVARFGFRQPRA